MKNFAKRLCMFSKKARNKIDGPSVINVYINEGGYLVVLRKEIMLSSVSF
jgi:hypothetical protein